MLNVEISCKTICKTQCNKIAKLCVNPNTHSQPRVKLTIFPHFPTTKSQLFTQPRTPILQLFYPLFHVAYYYNY